MSQSDRAIRKAFVDSLDDGLKPLYSEWGKLTSNLHEALATARTKWPGVHLDDEAFASFVAQRICSDDKEPSLPAATIDLYLVAACLKHDEEALVRFEQDIFCNIQPVFLKLGLSAQDSEDLGQDLRERLIVGREDKEAALTRFLGTGNLIHWIRAVASREALATYRGKRNETSLEEQILEDPSDPLLSQLKERYRNDFKEALHTAIDSLEPREHLILQALISDGRSVAEVASLYKVHRVTASRWIAKIRKDLFSRTRKNLRARLRVSEEEFDSVVRMIESQMEMSLVRVLDKHHSS